MASPVTVHSSRTVDNASEIRRHVGDHNYLVESKGSLPATLLQRVPTRLQAKALAVWDFGPQGLATAAQYVRWTQPTEVRRGDAGENI